jgi:hypothetical protein
VGVVAASLSGCLPSLNLVPRQATSGKPSNVAVYFTVDTNEGHAVAGLTADRFSVFEDGIKVSLADGKQALLTPRMAAARYTLLLVDISGSVVGAKEVGEVIKAASAYAARPESIEMSENLAVYAFDGSADLDDVMPFAAADAAATENADKAREAKTKGAVMSLNGAITLGLKTLTGALAADAKPLKLGTLVVLTDGTNHSSRLNGRDLQAALAAPDNAKVDVLAVGIGSQVESDRLDEIGRNGIVRIADPTNLLRGFDAVVAKLDAVAGHYYLLSYCSPSRSGLHQVRIQARSADGLLGDFLYGFDATGFEAGCDPTAPSGFELAHTEPAAIEKRVLKKEPALPKRRTAHPASAPAPVPAPPHDVTPANDPFAP